MKLNVIVSKVGKVIGAFQPGPIKPEDGSEINFGVVPRKSKQ